jgi:tetratricopeptide (TPR) repeat protein
MLRYLFILLLFTAPLFALSDAEIKEAYYKSYNYEKIADYRDAIKSLSPVVKEYPKGYTVNLRLGWLYYLNENYADALKHYEVAMQTAPYSAEAKLGHLLPLLAQQKYEQVESEAYQILELDYNSYYGNLRLSIALRWQGKLDLAAKVDIKMLTLYPTDVNFLTELGLVRFYQGDKEAAGKIFTDVQILDPENETAKEYLGKLR